MSGALIPFDGAGEEPVIPFDVDEVSVVSVELTVPTISLEVGTTGSAYAIVRGVGDVRLPGRTVTWVSSNDTVIADPSSSTTGADGRVLIPLPALDDGTTTITATCDGVDSDPVTVTVFEAAGNPGYSTTGSARITIVCSTVLKRNRAKPRRFSDADQRKIDPTDTSFSRVKHGVDKQIVWPNRELMRRLS